MNYSALADTVSARAPDKVALERLENQPRNADILNESGDVPLAETRAAVDGSHEDLHISSRNCAAVPQRPAILVCADSDGGLLVVSGRGGGPPTGQTQVQTHAEVETTGSKALCGKSVEFKCQSLYRRNLLSLSLSRLSSLPLSSLLSPPVFVRVGD